MARKPSNKSRPDDPVLRELDAIKRLMILSLYRSGESQTNIARALAMDAGDLSRLLPASAFKRTQKRDVERSRSAKEGSDE